MNRVITRDMIVPNMHLLTLEVPDVARKIRPGQFVIVRPDENGERIPLSVADFDRDKGTLTMVFMEVGASTGTLAGLKAGDSVPTCVGPLGNPTETGLFGKVMLVGGCYGIGSLYPVCRELKQAGNTIVTVLEARSSYLLYWAERYGVLSERLFTITRDGSLGMKGHITHLVDVLHSLREPPDRIIVNGCTFLMARTSELTRELGIPTIVNLNPIMIDGTGMCGVCRVTVANRMKFACVDGPEFNGHEVDWKEFLARRKQYVDEETLFYKHTEPKGPIHKEGKCLS